MWESRSASARIGSVGVLANAVAGPVFNALKLEMCAQPVKPAQQTLECGNPAAAAHFRQRRSRDRGMQSKFNANPSPIPDLNINNFIRFQRLAEVKPQQRI